MPRKRYRKDLSDDVLNAFAEGLNSRRDWRQFLAQADYSEYKIDQFMREINQNGLIEIVTIRGGDMLVSPEDLSKWLKRQSAETT